MFCQLSSEFCTLVNLLTADSHLDRDQKTNDFGEELAKNKIGETPVLIPLALKALTTIFGFTIANNALDFHIAVMVTFRIRTKVTN